MPRYTGPILDPHIHLYRYDPSRYPWLSAPGFEPLRRDHLAADYRAAIGDLPIRAAVVIEAVPTDPVAEVVTVVTEAAASGGLVGGAVVGHAPLDAPDLPDRLDRLAQAGPVVGIRDIVSHRPGGPNVSRSADLMARPRFLDGLRILAARDWLFELMLLPHQLADAAALLARAPESLRVVVNHAGSPEARDADGFTRWRDGMVALARLPAVSVKLSALQCLEPRFGTPAWHVGDLHAVVEPLLAAFGADRCAFASDWPVHDRTVRLVQAFDDFLTVTAGLSPAEQRALFHDTAARLYGLAGIR